MVSCLYSNSFSGPGCNNEYVDLICGEPWTELPGRQSLGGGRGESTVRQDSRSCGRHVIDLLCSFCRMLFVFHPLVKRTVPSAVVALHVGGVFFSHERRGRRARWDRNSASKHKVFHHLHPEEDVDCAGNTMYLWVRQ